jgi:hypothetical protein
LFYDGFILIVFLLRRLVFFLSNPRQLKKYDKIFFTSKQESLLETTINKKSKEPIKITAARLIEKMHFEKKI